MKDRKNKDQLGVGYNKGNEGLSLSHGTEIEKIRHQKGKSHMSSELTIVLGKSG